MTPFRELRRQLVLEILEKYSEYGTHTLAKKIMADYPEFFATYEAARSCVKYHRGISGVYNRAKLKDRKYVRKPLQLS